MIRPALERRVGIDERALAAFRIALGALLLFDLCHRARSLAAFYTDDGVLPRAHLLEQYPLGRYSVHALSGEPWAQIVLFGCSAILAIALLVGYRTRTATALSALLLFSLHFRNPFVLNGADRLLRELLVLAVFLPLGDRWAVDARGRADRADRNDAAARAGCDALIATPATAAILVHVVVLFVSNAVLKTEGSTWYGGDALGYALRQDGLTLPLGEALANYPLALTAGTYAWAGLVTGAPLLLLLTGRLRTAYAAAVLAAVSGMAVSLAVGLFPAVLFAAVLLFLPPGVWDALERVAAGAVDRVAPPSLERAPTTCRSGIDRVTPPRSVGSPLPSAVRDRIGRYRSVALVGVLAVVLLWSGLLLGATADLEPADSRVPDDYQWTMFAPDPSTTDGGFAAVGHVDEGADVDVFRSTAARTGHPPAVDAGPDFRWRKYLYSLLEDDARADRFAGYVCERASATSGGPVESVTVTYTERRIALGGEAPPPETTTVVERSC
ncbi:hypothetical protein A6E15_11415 [Natrinema saccharevitans]|uniref:HTTM-like domain-containing protein n=1 Tax=Natrinema saccharevitans TaxID=301967 RepID=A0A1S8AXI2_9EURY|nr:hypothetical protein [Natrinema saccharevitans]OLZ41553.1 hypothetical protein A6E15_11415 [Natrinema saccharevitans]